MKLHFLAAAFCLLFITGQTAQGQYWDWAKSVNGPNGDGVYCVETDAHDNIYIGGGFRDTMYFTPTDFLVAPTNYTDGFIAKYDSSGTFLWGKKFGGNNNDYVRDISIDTAGFVYVACYARSSNTVSYGSFSYTGTGNDKTFIIKIDPQGNLVWGKLLTAGTSNAYPTAISANAGIVAVTGSYAFLNMVIETDTLFHAGSEDIFLAVYESSTGNLLWTKAIKSQFQDYGKSVVVDDSANIYLSGIFNATLSIGGADTLFNPFGYEMFLCKHNANGDYLWAKRYYGTNDHLVDGMTLNKAGDIYIAGFHSSGNHVLNDTTFTTLYSNNFFLQKLDYNGNSYWTKIFHVGSLGRISAIATDSLDNVYMAGYLGSAFNLGNFQVWGSSSNYRNFLAKINSSGDVVHAIDGGNRVNNNGVNNLACGSNGVYLVGFFGTAQGHTCIFGNDTLVSAGGSDGYLVKYKAPQGTACTVVADFTTSATQICTGDTLIFLNQSISATHYAWYFDGVFAYTHTNASFDFYQPGTYDVMLVAFDSICSDTSTIQIQVQQAFHFYENQTICKGDSYSFGAQTLTNSGYYTNAYQSINGCDSVYHLFLNVHEIDTSVLVFQNVLTAVANNLTYQWVDCDNNFAPIQGAGGQQFTALQNGHYAVILSDSLCSDTSACYNITSVGIPAKLSNKDVVYYPNPAKDVLFVEVNEQTHFKMYDVLGNKVMTTFLPSGISTINLSNISSGLFIIVFEFSDHNIFDKILIH